jgi:hypothetical protein
LVGASIGRLSEEDQDRFADGLAEVIGNWPGQSGPLAAELMRTEGLRVEAADLIAAALLEAEPAFGEVEPRLDLLRAVGTCGGRGIPGSGSGWRSGRRSSVKARVRSNNRSRCV